MHSVFAILIVCVAVTFGQKGVDPVVPVVENVTTTSTEVPVTTTTAAPKPNTTSATTTVAPPTTVTPPVPSSNATVVSFNVTDGNLTCIMVELEADFAVPYTKTDNKSATGHIVIPPTATASGSCGVNGTDQTIFITWPADAHSARNLTLVFSSDGKKYAVASIELGFVEDKTTFPDDTNAGPVSVKTTTTGITDTQVAYSYQCKSKQSITLSSEDKQLNVTLELSHAKLQAFSTVASFGDAELCDADASATSDIVPIAVGCALAALVVIVIVAYLIGRRRAKSKGYQSM